MHRSVVREDSFGKPPASRLRGQKHQKSDPNRAGDFVRKREQEIAPH